MNRVYRTNYLERDLLAVISPDGGYKGRYSRIALCWLMYMSRRNNIHIRHAANGGEQRVLGRYVDGLSDDNRVWQFHGCMTHACTSCVLNRDDEHPWQSGQTMDDVFHSTMRLDGKLVKAGYKLTVMWECQFLREMKQSNEIKELYDSLANYEPIKPSDVLMGGRVEPFWTFKEANDDEIMKYYDVTSLYPYCNKYCKYFPGFYDVYVGDDIPSNLEGVLKCTILPPDNLLLPVLPYRTQKGKLLFPLCKTCAEGIPQSPCKHSDDERCLTGSWITYEVEKAIEKGYKIVKRHEAWHFKDVRQYDKQNGSEGVWSKFITDFVRLKLEASGFPHNAESDDKMKDAYIQEVFEHEGVMLRKERIIVNPGLRYLAKLMLNRLVPVSIIHFHPMSHLI